MELYLELFGRALKNCFTVAYIVLMYCANIGFGQSSSVFLETPATVWVKPNDDATIRWSVGNDVDLMTASIDVYTSGNQELFIFAPGTNQAAFYQPNLAARYSQPFRDSSTISFKLRQIQASDMGRDFKCKLFYDDNTYMSHTVVIVVDAAPSQPRIDVSPNFPVLEGTYVRLDCTSTSDRSLVRYSEGLVYEWTAPGLPSQRYRMHENTLHVTDLQRDDNNTNIGCKVRESLSDWHVIEEIVVMVTAINTSPPENRPPSTMPSTSPTSDDSERQAHYTTDQITEDATGILTTTPNVVTPQRQDDEKIDDPERKVLYGVIGALIGVFLLITISVLRCWICRRRSTPKSTNSNIVPNLHPEIDLTRQLSSVSSQRITLPSTPCVPQEVIVAEDMAGNYSSIIDALRGPLPAVPDWSPASGPASDCPQSMSPDRELVNGLVYRNTSTRNLANIANERQDSQPNDQGVNMDIRSEYMMTSIDSSIPAIRKKFDLGDGEYLTTVESKKDETYLKAVVQSPPDNPYSATPHTSVVQDMH